MALSPFQYCSAHGSRLHPVVFALAGTKMLRHDDTNFKIVSGLQSSNNAAYLVPTFKENKIQNIYIPNQFVTTDCSA
jgi:hypothetical protein